MRMPMPPRGSTIDGAYGTGHLGLICAFGARRIDPISTGLMARVIYKARVRKLDTGIVDSPSVRSADVPR